MSDNADIFFNPPTLLCILPMVVITVIEYRRAPEKFHGCSEEYHNDQTSLYNIIGCTWNVLAVITHPRLLNDGGLVGVDGRGHLQGPVGEMECVVSEVDTDYTDREH